MRTELLDYPLPEHAIAQHPAQRREDARLLVVGAQGLKQLKAVGGLAQDGEGQPLTEDLLDAQADDSVIIGDEDFERAERCGGEGIWNWGLK